MAEPPTLPPTLTQIGGRTSNDFLEQPAFSVRRAPPVFSAGDTLSGRFVVTGLLGRGGMGEVYRANDIELGAPVALKTLPAQSGFSESSIDRLRREVLRARSVSHPNVCRVFDLFTHVDDTGTTHRYLTMELIEGATLAARLEAGPLPSAEAAQFATQIAAALDEAHKCGIVHRDLKPSNVMIDRGQASRGAVVTDFGLALAVGDSSSGELLRSSERGGTRGYAAPEQLEAALVGPQADVYAFGVLVHELFTGELPDITRDGQPTVSNRLPRPWTGVVRRCLSIDPAERPPTAGAVVRTVSVRRHAMLAAVLTGFVVALIATVLRFAEQSPSPDGGNNILIAEVANETSEKDLSVITQLVQRQLEQSPLVNVIPRQQLMAGLRDMGRPPDSAITVDVGRELLLSQPSGYLMSGHLRKAGAGYVLTLRVELRSELSGRQGRSWARSYEARDRDELRLAVQRGTGWMRATIGERPSDISKHDRSVAEVTTNSWGALDLYADADRLLSEGRQDDALALLGEAVRVDPEFAAAWMRLGDVLMSRREHELAYESWNKALAVLNRRNLGTREEYHIRGMFASDTHNYVEAERVYRLYLLAYPNDFAPYFYIARPLLMLGRVDDAIAMLEAAGRRNPTEFSIPAQLAMYNLRAGRWPETLTQITRLREIGRGDWAECIQAQLEFLRGDYAAAFRRFTSLERSEETLLRARAPILQASLLADLGRTQSAIERLVRANESSDQIDSATRADTLLALAYLRLQNGDRRGCRDACLLSQQVDRSPVRLAQAAALLARAGDTRTAQQLVDQLPANSPSRRVQADRARVGGEILLSQGRPREALEAFQRAASLEAPGVQLEYLARGSAAAGESGTALALYERIARDSPYYWRYPDNDLPGTWFASLRSYLKLARSSNPSPAYTELLQRSQSLAAADIVVQPPETRRP